MSDEFAYEVITPVCPCCGYTLRMPAEALVSLSPVKTDCENRMCAWDGRAIFYRQQEPQR